MIDSWKRQFTLKQVSLTHEKPITFVISQWQKEEKPNIVYLLYRWVIALIFFITFVISIVDLKNVNASSSYKAKWLIYLTNWAYTVCTFQALIVAIILTVCLLAPKMETPALKFYKFYWVSNVIATDIAFGVTSLYWGLIYDEKSMALDAMNFLFHADNSILMFIDLFVVAHPIRLLHCCYPILFGICYAVFSVVYYEAGGISREGQVYIYNILDWRKPGVTTGVCFAVLAFIVIVHLICWALYKLRGWTHSKCSKIKEGTNGENEEKPGTGGYWNEGLASDAV